MVDLPIPDQPDVVVQTPQPRVSGRQYAQSGSFLAAGLDRLSSGLEDVATQAAEKQASDDLRAAPVTRDASGNIQVAPPGGFPILGAAGLHYEAAIKAGALAQGDNLARQDVTGLAAQHQGDPQGLLTSGQAYIANIRARNPGPLGETMAQRASDMLTQHYDGAVLQQASVGVQNSKQAIVDARANAFDTLSALSQQGKGPGDATYDKSLADWKATAGSLTANPAFGVSSDVMAANEKGDLAKLKAYAIVGQVDADSKRPGGTEAALKNARDAISDPGLNLSEAERQRMLATAEARVHFNTMVTASDRDGARKDFDAVRTAFNSGQISAPTADQIEAMHQKALSLGDATLTSEIEGFRTALQNEPARRMLLPAQQRNAQGLGPQSAVDAAPNSGGRVGGTTAGEYLTALSRGDVQGALKASEGLRTAPYWDVNHLRTGYGSDTVTRADGTVETVNASTRITAEDADRDLQRRTGEYAGGAARAIGPAWAKFTPAAQAAVTSMAYNYGHVPNDVVRAAETGDANALAAAIRGHASDNGGANFSRRQAEAAAVLGQSAAPAPRDARGMPFTPEQIRDNPFLVSNWVQAEVRDPENRAAYGQRLADSITRGLELGFAPDPNSAATLMQLAAGNPRLTDAAQKVQAAFEARDMTNGLVNLPPDQREVAMGHIRQLASGNDLYHQKVAEYAQKFVEADDRQIKETPFEYAVSRGRAPAPAPLNPNDANVLATGLHQRADILDGLGAGGAVSPTISVLDKAGKQQLSDAVAGGSGAQVQNVLSALSTTPATRRAATIADLGPAIMGAANSGDPEKMKAAYGFLGQQFDTNPVSFRKDFGKEAANQLLAYRNAVAFLPPDVAAKRVQGWSDQAQEETRKGVADIAKRETAAVSADQVAQKWSTFSYLKPWSWDGVAAKTPTTDAAATSGEGLRADYEQAYTLQRQLGMDPAHADANALQVLSTKWGVSGVNGNQVMQYPPEARYPAIGGSHSWINDQLDKDVLQASGADKARDLLARQSASFLSPQLPAESGFSPADRNALAIYHAPRAIAADATTEAEINAGKPPTYYIAVKDDRGLWNPLTDPGGKLVRFRPDPQAVPAVAATHAPGFTTGGGGWHGTGPDDAAQFQQGQ